MQLPSTCVVDDLDGRFFCAPRTRNNVFICHRTLRSREGTDTRAHGYEGEHKQHQRLFPARNRVFPLLGNLPIFTATASLFRLFRRAAYRKRETFRRERPCEPLIVRAEKPVSSHHFALTCSTTYGGCRCVHARCGVCANARRCCDGRSGQEAHPPRATTNLVLPAARCPLLVLPGAQVSLACAPGNKN